MGIHSLAEICSKLKERRLIFLINRESCKDWKNLFEDTIGCIDDPF